MTRANSIGSALGQGALVAAVLLTNDAQLARYGGQIRVC